MQVSTIGGRQADIARRMTTVTVETRDRPHCFPVYVLRCIGIKTPRRSLKNHQWNHLQDLDLADPDFRTPGEVELLLGADVYGQIVLEGIRKGCQSMPIAQRTTLGWIVTGSTELQADSSCALFQTQVTSDSNEMTSDNILRKFWDLEDIPQELPLSRDEQECERLFKKGCRRSKEGRYIVRLPQKPGMIGRLGDTKKGAEIRMSRLRDRLSEDHEKGQAYRAFMADYEQAGHMRLVEDAKAIQGTTPYCYLPHHGIWQRADDKQKLRVVFNASFRSTSGVSLNDALYTGPALQRELWSIIVRWRFHPIVFCTDIGQMYRQIWIDKRDLELQRIVWQSEEDRMFHHYQLLTVTYGMACAPYLAIRTLRQLAADEGSRFPGAQKAIYNDTYVDDIVTGADDTSAAVALRDELMSLLKSGGFPLRKWVSNDPQVLDGLPRADRLRPSWKDFKNEGPVNALGISWDPVQDQIRVTVPAIDSRRPVTKREVLSCIARLFDPIGWLAPVIITAKILMQDLWKQSVRWDELLPPTMMVRWQRFQDDLPEIKQIRIPRWLGMRGTQPIQIHGFADASQKGYAAVVYICLANGEGCPHLLSSKTRVAPVKSITIPRLELCAAVLLVRLLRKVVKQVEQQVDSIYAWTDSLIVLSWLASEPSRWTPFVSHRVSEIQMYSKDIRWSHVSSGDNPADLASRGVRVGFLTKSSLWWHGPTWLRSAPSHWPPSKDLVTMTEYEAHAERRDTVCCQSQVEADILSRFSSLTHMIRVIARCLKFGNIKERIAMRAPLKASELQIAFERCAYLSQQLDFKVEIQALKSGKLLNKRNKLAHLHPFLDSAGILRVGGRLQEASLPYTERHPMILSKDSHLSNLILEWAHRTSLHGGASLSYSFAVRRAWIIGGRRKIRSVIRKYVTCIKSRARSSVQMMGSLPRQRLERVRPFSKVGVDYAGPLQIKTTHGRGIRSKKGFIAVFVCLCTKAVHLEAVGDLTTACFLGALRRFISRRGTPTEMWSDNATTFRGADIELRSMLRATEVQWNVVTDTLANDGINWRFIPPSAPHFGGLWEAAVKSAKSHLKRTIGAQILTHEELSTLLTQIEFFMNSRPLTALSGEPDDLQAITPWHLLTGYAPRLHPEPDQSHISLDHLSHWRLIQGMRDQFWLRWAREYINTIQQRNRWVKPSKNYEVNDLVLIMDPSLIRQGRWPMGRIIKTHPGRDSLIRVVTIRTATGTCVRPITKLSRLLPI